MFTTILFALPLIALALTVFYAIKMVQKGSSSPKAAFMRQLCLFLLVGVACCTIAATTSATAEVPDADLSTQTETVQNDGFAQGMGYLAAAIVTGLSGIGGGIAVAAGAPAAIGATSEDPKAFGKALIFVALGEGIALYGLLVSILILTNL